MGGWAFRQLADALARQKDRDAAVLVVADEVPAVGDFAMRATRLMLEIKEREAKLDEAIARLNGIAPHSFQSGRSGRKSPA